MQVRSDTTTIIVYMLMYAAELVELMGNGKAKSVEVVTAFCKRAAIAQQCVNCLTEIFFEEAIARARECDDYLEKHGKTMGALHGLPISLKVRYRCYMYHPHASFQDQFLIIMIMGFNFTRYRTHSTSKVHKQQSDTSHSSLDHLHPQIPIS